ncbi:MAG: hypothetical protein ABEJ36_02815 [Candidatus Nanosalina sp.]
MGLLDRKLDRNGEDGENWVEEKYGELEETVEEIDSEIGVDEIREFTENTVESGENGRKTSRGEYFRPRKSDRNGPFLGSTDIEELERYAEIGFLDTGDFGGFYDLYTLTELGEQMLDIEKIEDIEEAGELLEEEKEAAAKITTAEDRELDQETDRPVTSGEPDEDLVVKQMQKKGVSKTVLTPRGREYRQKMEEIDVRELQEVTKYDRVYEPSGEDRLRVLKEGLPRLDTGEKKEEVRKGIEQVRESLESYEDVEPVESDDFREFNYLVGEALEALDHYTDLADEELETDEEFNSTIRHKVEGLKSFYSAAEGEYSFSNGVETKERNRESISSTYRELLSMYQKVEEDL